MNTKVTDEIVERIRKCLALAHGKNATQGEMEVAMAKAKEIAMRYSIDIGTVGVAGKDDNKPSMTTDRGDIKLRSKKPQKYHYWINAALQEIFGIKVVRTWNAFIYIGETVDVAICSELFPWLEDVFYSTYNTRANVTGKRDAAAKNGTYWGLYRGLVDTNKRAEAALSATDKQSWALVVVNKSALVEQRMKEEFPSLKEGRKSSLRKVDHSAYEAGYEKGKSINLRQTSAPKANGLLS